MKTADEILKEVEAMIEKPFVTAKFGDNWRAHQKRMLDEGQITVDMLLDIAWKQGRKALLLEDVVKNNSSSEALRVALPSDEDIHKICDKYFRQDDDSRVAHAWNIGFMQGIKHLRNELQKQIERGNDC